MYSFNLWHKFNLLGTKACLITFVCICTQMGFAQTNRSVNLPDYDKKKFHYGFLLGVNFTRFQLLTSPAANGSGFVISPRISPGFSLGLSGTYQPTERIALRFTPTAVFNQRIIDYNAPLGNSEEFSKVIESTMVDLPLMVKYKSNRRGNLRAYLIAGIKGSFSLSTRTNEEKEIVRAKTSDTAIEFGFGFEHFFEMFKFAPEIRFSQGLGNVLIQDRNTFSLPLQRLTNQSVSLFLFFE